MKYLLTLLATVEAPDPVEACVILRDQLVHMGQEIESVTILDCAPQPPIIHEVTVSDGLPTSDQVG